MTTIYTETIDRLFLELSQFTQAKTSRDLQLDQLRADLAATEALLASYREALENAVEGATDMTDEAYAVVCKALAIPTPTAALNEAMNSEKLNPWKCVLIGLNVTYWSYKKEHDNDPRAALNDLLAANAYYAADPQVSEIAAKHVNEAIARELESMADSVVGLYAGNIAAMLRGRANELRGK